MTASHRLELISFDLCPYVERSRIVLHAKGLPYDIRFVDLMQKPDWFLAISPRGKVPVLLVDGRPVFESMVINEMLEELYPEMPMFPRDPVSRAQARGWIVFANDVLMPATYERGGAVTSETRRACQEKVAGAFAKVEEQLASRGSAKFFFGDELGLADAAYAPALSRWQIQEGVTGDPLLSKFPALAEYTARVTAHPSAVAARAERFAERYRESVRVRQGLAALA
jgi:glutathione S-transferase